LRKIKPLGTVINLVRLLRFGMAIVAQFTISFASMPNDPAIEVASAIAAATHGELIFFEDFQAEALTGGSTPIQGATTPTQRLPVLVVEPPPRAMAP